MRIILLAAAAAAAFARPAAASMVTFSSEICPVCLGDVTYREAISGTVFGTRLDMKPLGLVMSPPELPVCDDCGFVVRVTSATRPELAVYREAAVSPEYKAIAGRSSYYKLAWLQKKSGGHNPLAQSKLYLRASWQEETDPQKSREDLELALAETEAWLRTAGREEGDRAYGQYMYGEYLRRLSRFGEAKLAFSELAGSGLLEKTELLEFVKFQRVLCSRRDAAPHALGEYRERGMMRKLGDLLLWPF